MKKGLQFFGFCNKGYEGQVINVECDIRNGFPGFDIIGLPDTAIKESRERVKTALRNCGFKFPQQRVLVSLSPASVPKSGSLMDLSIALAILFAARKTDTEKNISILAAGELTLDGKIVEDYSTIGAIEAAKKNNCKMCLIPIKTETFPGVCNVNTLTDAFLKCGEFINCENPEQLYREKKKANNKIFSDVIGFEKEKEFLTICAAGRHSLLLFGPPGAGKTLLCSRIINLLEDLDDRQMNEVQHVYGCAGLEKYDRRPPLRAVPHDMSMIQFTGGEGSLAHNGILLLDEITSFTKRFLEGVKDTYDKGFTSNTKSGELISYPASFMMIANMNACSCSNLGSPQKGCNCTSQKIVSHWNKVGVPLLERFDMRIPIELQDISKLFNEIQKPDSYYTDRIKLASSRQKARYEKSDKIRYNGQLHLSDDNILSLYGKEMEKYLSMSDYSGDMRSVLSTVSLARTIADTNDRSEVNEEDFIQAEEFKKYGTGDYFWRTIR